MIEQQAWPVCGEKRELYLVGLVHRGKGQSNQSQVEVLVVKYLFCYSIYQPICDLDCFQSSSWQSHSTTHIDDRKCNLCLALQVAHAGEPTGQQKENLSCGEKVAHSALHRDHLAISMVNPSEVLRLALRCNAQHIDLRQIHACSLSRDLSSLR